MMNKLIRSIIEINLKYQLFASPPWIQTLVGNSQEELKSTQVRWSHRTFFAIQSAGTCTCNNVHSQNIRKLIILYK